MGMKRSILKPILSPLLGLSLIACSLTVFAAETASRGPGGLKNLDTNQDGVVSFQEFHVMASQQANKLDTNQDGQLTVDEFKIRRPQGRRDGGGDANAGGDRAAMMQERMSKMAAQRFNAIDNDADGIVSIEDYVEHSFNRIDTDSDGILQSDELRAQRGRPGGGDRGNRPPRN
ncbi:MAG: hypothetical protein COC19_04015 [SAR86 cluster bacterium]|uniref:EF-hand domain-containing protein n=1 Tax=SAR86 cluster bacterium TaxID=2030880 RepID=A0A2A4MPP0_9GAMM|nr:MAG: hypothetical protein COC19_04015 [SAR86 cluster bacterium]